MAAVLIHEFLEKGTPSASNIQDVWFPGRSRSPNVILQLLVLRGLERLGAISPNCAGIRHIVVKQQPVELIANVVMSPNGGGRRTRFCATRVAAPV
jgi:hypothetical protein